LRVFAEKFPSIVARRHRHTPFFVKELIIGAQEGPAAKLAGIETKKFRSKIQKGDYQPCGAEK
jgi:hypothetical protein